MCCCPQAAAPESAECDPTPESYGTGVWQTWFIIQPALKLVQGGLSCRSLGQIWCHDICNRATSPSTDSNKHGAPLGALGFGASAGSQGTGIQIVLAAAWKKSWYFTADSPCLLPIPTHFSLQDKVILSSREGNES